MILRQSFDWSAVKSVDDLAPEEFDVKVMHPVGTTRLSIELWNRIFKKNFFQVRHELKAISIENFEKAHATDLDCTGKRESISRSRITLLSDDDDWLSNKWLQKLPWRNSKLQFCRWLSVKFDGEFFARPNSRKFSFTNNYCVYPAARSQYKLSDVYQHFDQSRIHKSLQFPLVDYVDLPLTITHKHPASANTMRQLLVQSNWSEDALRESVMNYVQKCRLVEIPSELEWTAPLIEKSCSVFESLV